MSRLSGLLLAFLVFVTTVQFGLAQGVDTTQYHPPVVADPRPTTIQTNDTDEEYLTPQMGLSILLAVLTLAVIVTIGLVFTVVMLLTILILSLAGGAGLLAGLYKRSVQDGFRTFFALGFAGLGAVLGGLVFWAIPTIQHWSVGNDALLPLGGICLGFIAGYGTGILLFLLLQKVVQGLLKRLTHKTGP